MMKVLLAQSMPQQQVDPHGSLYLGVVVREEGRVAIDGRSRQDWRQPIISGRVGKGRL